MSSAILYLAIIAIWACVLIPRWLRRGTSAAAPAPATAEADPEVEEDPLEDDASDDGHPVVRLTRVPEPVNPEEARRRMLAARRRLLLMLIGLEIAAICLAVLRLAAVWVVVPPSIMLAGYVLLLREAGRADAERAEREAAADAAARAREHARGRGTQSGRATPAEGTSTEGIPEAAAALAAKFAAAPVPADYEDAGRDFAPGLAGKYTASNADADAAEPAEPAEPAESADEDYDDYYEAYDQPRLRAVGD
jgi:hypothetical protein